MHLWGFLNRIPKEERDLIIWASTGSKALPMVLMLLSHFDSEDAQVISGSIEEGIRLLLKSQQKLAIRMFAHEALGRIFFFKGLYSSAYVHFRKARKLLVKLVRRKPTWKKELMLVNAKLLVWIGLSALNTGKFRVAAKALKKAANLLQKMNQEALLGEVRALLGDALSFIDPEKALNEYETAYEILLRYPSSFLLTTAIKLFAGFVIRNYVSDAIDILYEAFNMLYHPNVLPDFSMSFYKSFLRLKENTYFKVLYSLNMRERESELKVKLILGLEGVKGVYYAFRMMLKPWMNVKNIMAINRMLLITHSVGNAAVIDEALKKKDETMKRFERAYVLLYRKMGYESDLQRLYSQGDREAIKWALKSLLTDFRKVGLIGIEYTGTPKEYIVSFYELPSERAIIEKVKLNEVSLSELGKIEDESELSDEIAKMLGLEPVLLNLSSYGEGDVLIFSPTKETCVIPIERLLTVSGVPLGLKTNVVRVPAASILIALTIQRKVGASKKVILIDGDSKEKEKVLKKALSEAGVKLKLERAKKVASVKRTRVYHYMAPPVILKTRSFLIPMARTMLTPEDVEKLEMSGDVAFLDYVLATQQVPETPHFSNLAISMILAGFKSVVATAGYLPIPDTEKAYTEFYSALSAGDNVARAVLKARRKLYESGLASWHKLHLYGDPRTVIA